MLSQNNVVPLGSKESWQSKHTIHFNGYQVLIDFNMIQSCSQPYPLWLFRCFCLTLLWSCSWCLDCEISTRQFPEDLNDIYGVECFVVWGLRLWVLVAGITNAMNGMLIYHFTSTVCLYFLNNDQTCDDNRKFTMIRGVGLCIKNFRLVCFSLAIK